MTFTAIDFETADTCDPCEIGITRVENGEIVFQQSWLIKPACYPYMNFYHQQVHGISSKSLANAPTFDELWPKLVSYFDDQTLVAHNAAFDMRVLCAALQHYDLALPYVDYFCSVAVSRKLWPTLPNHKLNTVSSHLGIRFSHHRAGDDAMACAHIVLKAFDGHASIDEGLKLLKIKPKALSLLRK